MKQYLLLVLTALLFTGCGVLGNGLERGGKEVQEGMTTAEVRKILGNPLTRSFENGMEEWLYYVEAINPPVNITRIVVFKAGKVVALESYVDPRMEHLARPVPVQRHPRP